MIVKIFCDPECRFDFNFYHGLAKRAVDRLKGKNKNRASVWLEALEKAEDNDVRVIYVKLLIIQCITNKLLPPFNEDPIPGNVYEYYRPNETCLDMVYQYYKTLERMRELPKQIDFEKVDERSTDYLTFVTKHLMPIPGYHFVYGCSKDTIDTWQYASLPPILDESSDEDVRNSWFFQGESRTTLMELKDSDLFPISSRIRPLWGSNLSPVISKDETPVDQPTDVSLPYLTPPIKNYYDYMRSVGLRRLPFRPKLPRDSFERSRKDYSKTDLSPIRERDIFYQVSQDEFSADYEDTMDLDGEVVSYSDFIKSDIDIDLDKTPPRVDPTKFLQGEFSPDSPPFMSTPIKPKKAPILHSSLELRKKKRPLVPGIPYMVPETRVPKTKLPYIYELERFIESPEKVPPRLPIKDIDLDLSEPMVFQMQSSADMLDYVDDSDVLLTESAAFDDIAKFLQEEKLKSPPRSPVADKHDIESLSSKSSETEYFSSKDYLQTESQTSTSKSSLAESEYYSGEEQMPLVESVTPVAPVLPVAPIAPVAPVAPIAPIAPLPSRVKRRVRFNIPEASKNELKPTVVDIIHKPLETKTADENKIIDSTEEQLGDSFIEESKRDYKWMADLSGGPGLSADEEQASDLWESFGWWTDDPDEIFQYFPPSPRAGRSLAEIYNIPDRWYEAPPTPPIFSKDPRIREGIGAKRIYAIEEFGMDWFEEPVWTDAEMFFRRKHQASPYTNPRDIDRRTLDMTQFPLPRSPKQIFEIEELFKAEDFIDSEVTPHLHEISFEDTDFKEMTRSEAIIGALRQGPMPSPKSKDESESITEDEKIKESAIEVEKEEEDGEWMDMEILDRTPPSFIKYHKTPPSYTVNTDIDFDESISKYLTEDLKIIHGDKPQSPKEETPRQIRPKRLSFESPELVSDKYDVIPSPEWKTPKRHIIPPQKDIDWITDLPSPLKEAKETESTVAKVADVEKKTKPKKRKPIILYPGMTQEAVEREIEMMEDITRQKRSFIRGRQIIRELKKTFSTPPPAPGSPEPEPHIFDEPIPTDLPRALAPPSGWNWKTPEAMKKGEYKKPVIKTPTGVSPVRKEPTGFSEDVGLFFESPPKEALSPTSAIGPLMFSPDKSFEEYIEGKPKEKTPSPIRSPIRSPGGKPIAQQRELQRARDEIDFVQIYPDQFDLIDEEGVPELYQSPEKEEIPDYLQKIREQEIELGLRPRSPKTFKELQEAEIRMLEKEIFESTEPSQFKKPTEPEVLKVDSPKSPEYKRRAWRQALELYKPLPYDKGQYIRYVTERRTRTGKIFQIRPYEAMDVIQEDPFNEPVALLWQGTPARKPEIKEIRSPIMTPDHLRPNIYPNEPTSPDAEYIDFGLPSPERHEYVLPKVDLKTPIEVTPQKRRFIKKPKKLEFEPESSSSEDENRIAIQPISPKMKRERKPRRIDFDEPIHYTPGPVSIPENWEWRTPRRFTKDDIYSDKTVTDNIMSESPPAELYSPKSEIPPAELYSPKSKKSPTAGKIVLPAAFAGIPMKSLLTESSPFDLYSPELQISPEQPKSSETKESPPRGLYIPKLWESPLAEPTISLKRDIIDYYSSKEKPVDILKEETIDFLEITDTPLISIYSPKISFRRSPKAVDLASRTISAEIRQEEIESDASTSYASFALPSTKHDLKRKYPRSDANFTPPGAIYMTTPEDRKKAIKSDIEISSSDDESFATVRKKSKSDFTQETKKMLPRKKLDFDKLPSSSEEDEEEGVVQEYSSKTSRKQSSPLQDQTVTESILTVDESVTTQIQTATPTTRYARRRSSRIVSRRSPAALYPTQKTPSELLKSTPRHSGATAHLITEMTSPRVSPRQAVETIYATPTYDQTPERLPPKPQPDVVYVSEMTPSPSMMFESDVVYTIEDAPVTRISPAREHVSPIQEYDVVHAIKKVTPSARDSPVYAVPETAVSVTPRGESEAVYITPTARVSPVRKRRVKFALSDTSSAVSATPRRESEAVYVTQETAPITRGSSVPKRRIKFNLPKTSPEVETIHDIRKDTILSAKASPKHSPTAEYVIQETAPHLVQISPTPHPGVPPRQSPRIAYDTQEIAAPSSPTRHPIFIKPVRYQIRPSIPVDTDINIGTPTKYVKTQEVDETDEYLTGTYDTEKRRQQLLGDIQSKYGLSPERQPTPSPERERHMLDESVPKGLPNPLLGPTDWQWSTPVQFHKVPYKKPVLRTPDRISPIKPEPVGFASDVSLYFESPPQDIHSPTMVMEQFMSPVISPPRKSPKKSPLITQLVDKKHTSTPVRSPGGRPILQEWQIRPAEDEIEIAQAIPGHYMVIDEEAPPEELIYSPPNVIEVPEYLEKARLQELSLWGQEPLPTPPRVRKERKRLAAKRAAEEEIIARELAAREEAMAAERSKRTPVRYDDISDSELAELEKEVFGKDLTPINVPSPAPIHVTHRPIGVVRTPTQLNPAWLMAQTPESATRPYEPIPVPEAIRFEQRPTRHVPGETPPSPYGEYDTPRMKALRRRPRRQPREYVRKRLDFSQEEDDYGAEELQKLQDQYEESQHDILDESPPEMSTGEQLSILGDITDYEAEDFTLFLSPSGHNNAYLVESPFKRLLFTFEDTSPIRTELPDDERDFKWMD